jgi:ribosomal protein S18 acetylase RimI-like enzyme
MAAYRFCRPDDIPLLVEAVGACYDVHFPDLPQFTVEGFRSEMKEIDAWPSNSMVARAGDDPIAVLIGTKRETEVLILRIGVHAEHQRQGHALHLLTSLSQKLAVLGPERLVAELPLDLPRVKELFVAAGYSPEKKFTDYVRRAGAAVESVPEELLIPVSVDDLIASDVLNVGDVAWERSLGTLQGRGKVLEGVAIATPMGIDAYLLYRPDASATGTVDIVALACGDASREEVYLGLLLRSLIARSPGTVRLPRLREGEVPEAVLASLGFEPGRRYERYSATATRA